MTRRTKPTGCYTGTEAAFQRTAIALVRTIAHSAGVDPRAIMHIPNGSRRPLNYGAFVKAQGMVAGYPDIMVYKQGRTWIQGKELGMYQSHAGLAIELKIWPNKPSDEQNGIHRVLESAGWKVGVCYGLNEVEQIVKSYLA